MKTVVKGSGAVPEHLWWGLEKENLRLGPEGRLAGSPHPAELELPFFSRDFAESQLETITPPAASAADVLDSMAELTDYASELISPERLWNYSMPPAGIKEDEIRIAAFDTNPDSSMSPAAREREVVYRQGLALRYGKIRQLISGIHLNFSVPGDILDNLYVRSDGVFPSPAEFRNEFYTALAGYMYRKLYMLLLFSAATPFVSPSEGGCPADSPVFSLRNMNSGYAGTVYRSYLNLDSFRSYLDKINEGTGTVSDLYHFLGTVKNGKAVQLNAAVFQQAKEFYAPLRIRCKKDHAGPPAAEYLELRVFDINPFVKTGIAAEIIDLVQLYVSAWISGTEFRDWLAAPYRYMQNNTVMLPEVLAAFDAVSGSNPETFDRDLYVLRWEIEKAELRQAMETLDRDNGGRFSSSLETLTSYLNGTGGLLAEKVIGRFRADDTFLRTPGARMQTAV